MQLPLNEEESHLLRAVLDEYLDTLREEMLKGIRQERSAALHHAEEVIRAIGDRLH